MEYIVRQHCGPLRKSRQLLSVYQSLSRGCDTMCPWNQGQPQRLKPGLRDPTHDNAPKRCRQTHVFEMSPIAQQSPRRRLGAPEQPLVLGLAWTPGRALVLAPRRVLWPPLGLGVA
jgi:hypothetical protein